MYQPHTHRRARTAAAVAAGAMLLCALPMTASAAGGLEMSTSYPGITAQAGDDLSFTMDFDNDMGNGQSVALSVTSLPEGWEGVFTGNGGQISRVFVRDGENTGLATFELSIPDDAADGTYTVGLLATGESGVTDTLTLELQLTAGETGTSSFEAQYPEQEGSASTAFSFDATLVNNSASQQTYTFSTNAPTGWTVTYQPTGETTQVASLAVDARSSQGVTVNVTPPATAEAGSYDISCSAVSANDTLSTDLSVVITGTYDLVLSTPSGLLSADAQAGKDTDITLTLTNNGNTDLQNINLTSTTPDGWAWSSVNPPWNCWRPAPPRRSPPPSAPARMPCPATMWCPSALPTARPTTAQSSASPWRPPPSGALWASSCCCVWPAACTGCSASTEDGEHMSEIIIETHGLTKRYDTVTAVDQLDLSIYRGEVFGLLGPNGAGKTTTTLMLLGLTEPTEGTATIAGHDCTREPLAVKSMVGYLPDNVGFYTDMTGRENLRFTGRLNGLSGDALEARIDGLLRRVGLEDAGDRKTGTYSRGMRQRLGIADVLIKDPRVIIMDEPTLGIDPEGMRDLLALIRRLSTQDQRTILLSSHQLQQVQQICDRVGIFVEGRLIACGPIAQLAQELRGDGGPILEVAATPNDAALNTLLEGLDGLRQLRPMDGGWLVQGEEDLRPVLARLLLERGYDIQRLCQHSDDLDEIYHNYFEKAGVSHDLPTDKKRGLLRRRA